VKFVVDGMLGKLGKWLRILGYDTLYYNDKTDEELVDIADMEGRVLLTKDTELAHNFLVQTFLVRGNNPEEQLRQVVRRFELDLDEGAMSRCPVCNAELKQVGKMSVKHSVPRFVFESYEEFWRCGHCDKIYWTGTHWRNIKQRIEQIREERLRR
jgi:hypothetical protein